jgi:hypothetical protein
VGEIVKSDKLEIGRILHFKLEFRKCRKHIAPSKAREKGIPNERMKPFERVLLVKVWVLCSVPTYDFMRSAVFPKLRADCLSYLSVGEVD